MADNDLSSLFAAARARNLIYGQNPPIDPNATNAATQQTANQLANVAPTLDTPVRTPIQTNQDIPLQQKDSVNVSGGQQQQIPYSPISRDLPPEVTDPNFIPPPQAATLTPEQQKLVDIRKQAPVYQEPSKVRKFLGNALAIGGDLAGIATGNMMIPALAAKGENYIEHEPYAKQVRAYNSQVTNAGNVAATQEEQAKELADINAKNFGAYSAAQRSQAEKLQGQGAVIRANAATTKVSEPYLLLQGRIKAAADAQRLNKGDQVKYRDADGNEGVAFVDQHYDPTTGRIEHHYVDAITNKPVDAISAIPIGKTLEAREGTGSTISQLATSNELGHTGRVADLTNAAQKMADINAKAAAANRGINPDVVAATNEAREQEARANATRAGYEAQDISNIHGNVNSHVIEGIKNPQYLSHPENFGNNKAIQEQAKQKYSEVTGTSVPQPLDRRQEDMLDASNQTVQSVVNLRRLLKDPEVQQNLIGPFSGRVGSLEQMVGADLRNLPVSTQQKAAEIRNSLALLKGNEARVAAGGSQGVVGMMRGLTEVAPNAHMSLNYLAGALKSIEDNANRNTLAVKKAQYGDYNKSDVVLTPEGHIVKKFVALGPHSIGVYNPKTRQYDPQEIK